jgi:hypothetical protein
MKKTTIAIAISSIASLAVGSTAGYFIAKFQLGKQFDERLKTEVEETKAFYMGLSKKATYRTAEDAANDLLEPRRQAIIALKEYQGEVKEDSFFEKVDEEKEFSGPTVKSIFDKGHATEEVSEKDKRNRTEEAPYILEKEEFLQNEDERTQSTLTYYAGDGILTDSRDDIIREVDETVGQGNLENFGYGSGDPKVVYVRNCALDIEYEILHHEGTYKQHVAGLG